MTTICSKKRIRTKAVALGRLKGRRLQGDGSRELI